MNIITLRFIYAVQCISSRYFLYVELYSIVKATVYLPIYLLANKEVG